MRSPFHAVMTTPVLDVRGLARLMREQAAAAHDETSRPRGEADAVLLGKLAMLDALAGRMWGEDLSGAETAELQAAANELGRAVEILTGRAAVAGKAVGGIGAGDLTDPGKGARDERGAGGDLPREDPAVIRCSGPLSAAVREKPDGPEVRPCRVIQADPNPKSLHA